MKGLRSVGLSLLCEHLRVVEMSKFREVHYVFNGNLNGLHYRVRKSFILRSNNLTPKIILKITV